MTTRPKAVRIPSLLLAIALLWIGSVWEVAPAGAAPSEGGASWTQQAPAKSPSARHGASMAFDPATGRVVLFGGAVGGNDLGDTWTYDGSTWTEQAPTTSPSARRGASMAFDPATGQMVLFGGSAAGTDLGDTWTYDGATWTKQAPAKAPSARRGASMAFDPAIGHMVLFGGSAGGTDLGDTWTYDGASWTQQGPATSPSPRDGASMTFDLGDGRIVLFGGSGKEGPIGDTWTYDGSTWSEVAPATHPTARGEAAMTFDQTIGKVVLLGGNGGGRLGDFWTYEGGNWTKQEPAPSPPPRDGAALAFDPADGQAILFGGSGDGGDLAETWTFGPSGGPEGNSTWYRQSPEIQPSGRNGAVMAFDPAIGRLVLFGGTDEGLYPDDTWTYDGDAWTRQSPERSPPPRYGGAMAFDPATGQMVLFGGTNDDQGFLGDTWTYDGVNWTEQSPAQSPSARYGGAMAFDPATGQMVLFGGRDKAGNLDETWTWDGATWTRLPLSAEPPGRTEAGMAFDPTIGKIVLFGGDSAGEDLNDTWTYDAAGWTRRSPWTEPPARTSPSMAFDPTTGRIVLFGGVAPGKLFGDTWTYDGVHWSEQSPSRSPWPRRGAAMAFDPAIGRTVLFAGLQNDGYTAETWTWQGPASGPQPTLHPRPVLFSPVEHIFPLGDSVPTSFGCNEADGGPGIRSCTDPDGASRTGTLDTSTLGEHTYRITGVSQNGVTGLYDFTYTVKARPSITVQAPASVPPGSPISAVATLSGGASPGGTIVFRVHGPNNLHCWKPVVASSDSIEVSGDGTYEMTPTFTPTEPGIYLVTAEYSGDDGNLTRHSECRETADAVTVGKVTTTTALEASPNPVMAGGWLLLSAHVAGSEPSGTITFKDGSTVLGVERMDEYRGTAGLTTSLTAGRHQLTAVYSGDEVNPPSTSAAVEEIVSEPTPPPGEPEEPAPPGEPEGPLPPVSSPPALPPLAISPTVTAPRSDAASPTGTTATAPDPASPAVTVSYSVRRARAPHGDGGALYTFDFTGRDSGSEFYCGLDRAVLAPCQSPRAYRHLTPGPHRFAVKTVGPNGVESAPRVIRFVVGRTAHR